MPQIMNVQESGCDVRAQRAARVPADTEKHAGKPGYRAGVAADAAMQLLAESG